MTLPNALLQLRNGLAARTPSMNGYIKREDYENNVQNAALFASANDDTVEAVFKVTFVENPSRTGTSPATYEFDAKTWMRADGRVDRIVFDLTDSTTMSVDAEFMQLLVSDKWEVVDLAEIQAAVSARTSGRW